MVLILLLFLDQDSWCYSGFWVLQLTVPGLFNSRDSFVAEVEPALKLGSLLDALLIFFFVLAAILIVELLLSGMAELKRDLNDLTQVHPGGHLAGWIVEILVRFELDLDKLFHRLQVILVESLTDQVEHQEALLVRDGAELERAHHVQHRLDDLLPESVSKIL